MATSEPASEDTIFNLLKKADPKELEQRQQLLNEQRHKTFQLSQARLAELIDQNSTLPTTVSSVTVLGAPNTRRAFLNRLINPLLSANRDRPYTQSELIHEISKTANKLRKFGISCPAAFMFFSLINIQESITNPSQSSLTNHPKPIHPQLLRMWPYTTQ